MEELREWLSRIVAHQSTELYPDSGIGSGGISSEEALRRNKMVVKSFSPDPDTAIGSEAPSNQPSNRKDSCPASSDDYPTPDPSRKIEVSPQDQSKRVSSGEQKSNPSLFSSNIIEGIVKGNMEFFVRFTDLNVLYPHIRSTELISTDELMYLQTIKNNRFRNETFYMFFLINKGAGAYSKLFECLKNENEHSEHKDLVAIIDGGLKEAMKTIDNE